MLEALAQGVDAVTQAWVGRAELLDALESVDDRRVVSSAKELADGGQRGVGELTDEVHGDLSGHGHVAMPPGTS